MKHWSETLGYKPCADAAAWLRTQPDAETAWATCQRGDWMLYHAGEMNTSEPYSDGRRKLTAAACACARLAWKWMPAKSREALIIFERWSNGEDIPLDDLRKASAAAASAYAYAASAYAYAASAYAYAAAAAYAADAYAAAAADAAAYAAYAAYAYAAAYAATYARTQILAQCADIVRKHYPRVPRR